MIPAREMGACRGPGGRDGAAQGPPPATSWEAKPCPLRQPPPSQAWHHFGENLGIVTNFTCSVQGPFVFKIIPL